MTSQQQLQAALKRIEKICDSRPELHPLGEINRQLLQSLFSATEPAPTTSGPPLHGVRCSEGVPIFHSQLPPLNEAILRTNWLHICQILSSNESFAATDSLAKAVVAGSLRASDQLSAVLSGSSDRYQAELQAQGLDVSLGFTVLRLSSLPLLAPTVQQLERQLQQRSWDRGDCPMCGNEPLLAEWRGLEQLRWLRCGWCASQWQMNRLQCPTCGNRDHRQLRDIIVDGQEDAYRLSVCDSCGASLPTLATLVPLSPPALLVAEMETLHLRIVAQELSRRAGGR